MTDDAALLDFFRVIAARDREEVIRQLDHAPDLATRALDEGASREDPDTCFLAAIRHHVYTGDTALHVAAAAQQREVAERLVAGGAAVRARNRRGAEPLHYAADGSPGNEDWDRAGQCEVIAFLVDAGADPNAKDKSGVAPLHRAVRTRSADAVRALVEHGADPRRPNKSGSTPLHLAVQNTGRSDSGSEAAKDGQRDIIVFLLERGAGATDRDGNGKTVAEAATSEWVRDLLDR